MAIGLLTATTAAAQQPKPLGSDLVTGKAGEHGHPVQIAMHFGDGAGGFTMDIIGVGSFSGHEVAVGDVNNDRKEDVVVVGANGVVSVALGSFADGLQNSDLTPSSPFVEGPGNCCERTRVLRLGDVNNDGNLDIVVTMWSKMAVKLGNGDGTFQSEIQTNATGFDARGMDIGDLDGDGILDLVANHAVGNWWLAFHKGNGNGTFQPGVVIANSALAIPNVYFGDADGDGDLDIYTGSLEGRVKIFTNNGAPNFTLTNLDFGSGLQGGPLVVDDLNGDGAADVVARTEVNGFKDVRVWLSNGSGGFAAADYTVGFFPFHGVLADVNKDGIKDIAMVTAGTGSGGIWILPGIGAGTFAAPYSVPGYRNNYTIAAANFKAPADTTPPVITPTITGTLGSGNWYTSNVGVTWAVSDLESTPASSGCDAQTVTADTPGVTFTCSATSAGGTSSSSVTITRDTTGPAIASATANPSMLWPPNHKMRPVTVSVAATDAGSGLAGCSIDSVSSNEGGNAHEPDVQLTGPLTLNLRAERSGKGAGRVYTAQITCTDAAGNTSTTQATVTVPHDQGKDDDDDDDDDDEKDDGDKKDHRDKKKEHKGKKKS